ncbi:MAG: ATP-binding protein [Candidatus Melainabacteria bacterium]|nr:MAG: ATP-binding protein [Candidatus Melainabacteria bacterium]
MSKIFDRFYRVENATHSIKGTGLGLHLVKISVEKNTITVLLRLKAKSTKVLLSLFFFQPLTLLI